MPFEAVAPQVVDQHVVAAAEVQRQVDLETELEVALLRVTAAGQRHERPRLEHDRLGQVADPQLRALEVGEDRDRPPDPPLDGSHAADPLEVVGLVAVREVQPEAVDAGAREALDDLLGIGRRPEGGDDLGAAQERHQRCAANARRPG